MKTLSRQLLALNMLLEDLQMESENIKAEDEACENEAYLKLLKQSHKTSEEILLSGKQFTEQEFMANVNSVSPISTFRPDNTFPFALV